MTTALAIRDEQHYLATVDEVRALALRIENVGDANALADKARAAQVWAERARLGQNQVNLAAMARLWAERRAGQLLSEMRGTGTYSRGIAKVGIAERGLWTPPGKGYRIGPVRSGAVPISLAAA